MTTKEMLDQLAELRASTGSVATPFQDKITALLGPEMTETIAVLNLEMAEAVAETLEEMAALEQQIKDAVLAGGTSVKGTHLQAVLSKGRVTWDVKALDGYAEANDVIKQWRKVGKPSVSIRETK